MALGSAIEWTESTWNPVTGCTKVSPACTNKKKAGRLLDGRVWSEMPRVWAAAGALAC
jgi:protein gp37